MAILCGDDMKYAWTDLETTGLDPKKGDILEVYVRVTDAHDLKEIDAFHAYVDVGCALDEVYLEKLNDFVRAMHTSNGLIDDLRQARQDGEAKNKVQLLDDLTSFLHKHNEGNPKNLYLAGNNVKFDYAWLEEKVGAVLQEVHYRTVDVSSTRVQLAGLTGEDWAYTKKGTHRAAADIDESIAEYKWLWKTFGDWCRKTRTSPEVDVWKLPCE